MNTYLNEREAFEVWYAENWAKATGKTQPIAELAAVVATMRAGDDYNDGSGGYVPYLSGMWEGWQARAALSTPPAAVPDISSADAAYWLASRAGIIAALEQAGFRLMSNRDGFWLQATPAAARKSAYDAYAERYKADPADPSQAEQVATYTDGWDDATAAQAVTPCHQSDPPSTR